jgi:hypothetical protein
MYDPQLKETSIPFEDQLAFRGPEILAYESLESIDVHIPENLS